MRSSQQLEAPYMATVPSSLVWLLLPLALLSTVRSSNPALLVTPLILGACGLWLLA
jgi:hypothetical protein